MEKRTMGGLVAILLVVAACGGDGSSDSTTPAEPDATTTLGDSGQEQATTSTPADEGEGATTTSAAEMMDGVHVADTDLGPILVDPDGFTLYIFTADAGGESACYDACADLWPPVPAATPVSSDLDASIFGSTTRTDGMEQLTVNNMPLYLYTPDSNPGDVAGHGFNDVWFVVDGDGAIIEAAAGNTLVDYGY